MKQTLTNGEFEFDENVVATQLESTIATGTPPLIVSSTTQVPNLTAEDAGDSVLFAGHGISEFLLFPSGTATLTTDIVVNGTGNSWKFNTGSLGFFNATPIAKPSGGAVIANSLGGGDATLSTVVGGLDTVNASRVDQNFASIFAQLSVIRTSLIDLGLITSS